MTTTKDGILPYCHDINAEDLFHQEGTENTKEIIPTAGLLSA